MVLSSNFSKRLSPAGKGSYSFIVTEPPGYFHRFCGISRLKAVKSDTCAGRHLWNFSKNLFFSHFSVIIVRYDICILRENGLLFLGGTSFETQYQDPVVCAVRGGRCAVRGFRLLYADQEAERHHGILCRIRRKRISTIPASITPRDWTITATGPASAHWTM